jgi:hypothetical protein
MDASLDKAYKSLLTHLFHKVGEKCSQKVTDTVFRRMNAIRGQDHSFMVLERSIREYFYEQSWIEEYRQRFEAIVHLCCMCAPMWFYTPLGLKQENLITIYIIYTFLADDEEPNVSDYTPLFCPGTTAIPFIASFGLHLEKMKESFSDEESWYLLRGLIDYVRMTRLEFALQGRISTLSKASKRFPWHWKQQATSASPYVALILRPCSNLIVQKQLEVELERYMSFVNDICSWYKERVIHTETTYEEMHSFIFSKSTQESFQHLLDETVISVDRCQKICLDEETLEIINFFFVGYLYWHLTVDRYKLSVFIDVSP